MRNSILSNEDAAWLAETLERNRQQFAGWQMNGGDDPDPADDPADDPDKDPDGDPADDPDKDPAPDDAEGWKAKFEAQQRINRNLERRTRKDATRIKQLAGGAKPGDKPKAGDQPDADQIREEARAEAAREVLHSRVEDKIEAKARKFADPEDAVAVLLRQHDHDDFLDDGKIDVEAIADALKELGEKKPHLLAQGGQRFKGDPDSGPRKEETTSRPKSLGDAIANHYKPRK